LAGQSALKALSAMRSLGKRAQPGLPAAASERRRVQIRVRAPFFSRDAVEPALKWVSYAHCVRGSTLRRSRAMAGQAGDCEALACRPRCLHAAACGFLL
jgi:hypothetical protein